MDRWKIYSRLEREGEEKDKGKDVITDLKRIMIVSPLTATREITSEYHDV